MVRAVGEDTRIRSVAVSEMLSEDSLKALSELFGERRVCVEKALDGYKAQTLYNYLTTATARVAESGCESDQMRWFVALLDLVEAIYRVDRRLFLAVASRAAFSRNLAKEPCMLQQLDDFFASAQELERRERRELKKCLEEGCEPFVATVALFFHNLKA